MCSANLITGIGKKAVSDWKQKARRELAEYWMNFIYLAVFFGVFTWYRRLILAEYDISYYHYGAALIEALVLAKVILLGNALKLGRHSGERPLIYLTLRKAAIFTVWVGLFEIIEHMIGGVLQGKGLEQGLRVIVHQGRDALLARCLVTFVAFVPFFAFHELGQTLGEGKLVALFFHRH